MHNIHTHVYTYTPIRHHTHKRLQTYTYSHTRTHTHRLFGITYINGSRCKNIHTHIHTYTPFLVHTHTHTPILRRGTQKRLQTSQQIRQHNMRQRHVRMMHARPLKSARIRPQIEIQQLHFLQPVSRTRHEAQHIFDQCSVDFFREVRLPSQEG